MGKNASAMRKIQVLVIIILILSASSAIASAFALYGILNPGQDTVNYPPQIIDSPPVFISLNAGERMAFHWEGFDPDMDMIVWSVDWGNGESVDGTCGSPANTGSVLEASHLWEKAGTFIVSATAKDCNGGSSKHTIMAQVVEEEVNLPPAILVSSSQDSILVGEEASWEIDLSDPENDALRVAVHWGDGSSYEADLAQGPNAISHAYQEPGEYEISIAVEDGSGNSAGTVIRITVLAPEPDEPPVGPSGGTVDHVGAPRPKVGFN